MWLHTPNGILEKFNTPTEIIDKFIEFRKPIYVSRREKMINILKQKKMMIDAQVRFIEAMLNDELDVRRKKR